MYEESEWDTELQLSCNDEHAAPKVHICVDLFLISSYVFSNFMSNQSTSFPLTSHKQSCQTAKI